MTDTQTQAAVTTQNVPAAYTFGQFVQLMEDGEFHGELSDALQKINEELSNHAMTFGGKPSGKLTVTIDFKLDKGIFEINGDYTVKTPKPPRGKTVVWGTPDNRFSAHNPKQMQMFGVRDATPAAEAEDIRSA